MPKKKKTKKGVTNTYKGNGKYLGLVSGDTFGKFITDLFNDQPYKRYSDEVLVTTLEQEFPHRRASGHYDRYIRLYRNIYNRGGWLNQNGVVPEPTIGWWDEYGEVRHQKSGPPPRPAYASKKRRK